MELQYRELENKIRLIRLIGELDISKAKSVESEFIVHCAGNQLKVIVDLSKVTDITHSGVQLFLWTAKEVVSRGGKFVVTNSIPTVEQFLKKNGVSVWAQSYPDIDTAVSYLLGLETNRLEDL